MRSTVRRIASVVLAVAVLAGALTVPAAASGTNDFRGVNWADPRDNYAADEVVPSGLSTADDYRTTYRKASGIVSEFRTELKANTIRLPINPSSVGTTWWKSYRAAIDASVANGYKVILSYWEADNAKDGRVDDPAKYAAMWDTVVQAYGKNSRVYFEPMNEPFGYSLTEWVGLTSSWIARHHNVPRSRIVISGTGYNDNVTGVGAAPELRGTLLSLHFYGFWASDTTEAAWLANLRPRIGSYGWRTIIDEAGSPMTIGLNYGNHEGNVYTAYLGALTQVAHEQKLGIVYWPGLRTGDSYSMTTQVGPRDLQVNSQSGRAQLWWGWGLLKREPTNTLPPAPPGEPLHGVASSRCVDVPGFSTSPGTALDLWDCNNGGNQSWNYTADKQLTVYTDKCMTAGASVTIETCTGAPNQTWQLNADQTITSTAGCLTATGTDNGAAVITAPCTGSDEQKWTRS